MLRKEIESPVPRRITVADDRAESGTRLSPHMQRNTQSTASQHVSLQSDAHPFLFGNHCVLHLIPRDWRDMASTL